jgi:hypothetical protein
MTKFALPLAAFASILLTSCSNEQVNNEQAEKNNFQEVDQTVWASSQLNYDNDDEIEYSETHIDTAFVNYILNELVMRDDIQLVDDYHTNNPVSMDEASILLSKIRTIHVEDVNNPGNFIETIDTVKITHHDVVEILSHEKWYFDKETVSMKKEVSYISPIVKTFDKDGAVRGKRIPFWIKLN